MTHMKLTMKRNGVVLYTAIFDPRGGIAWGRPYENQGGVTVDEVRCEPVEANEPADEALKPPAVVVGFNLRVDKKPVDLTGWTVTMALIERQSRKVVATDIPCVLSDPMGGAGQAHAAIDPAVSYEVDIKGVSTKGTVTIWDGRIVSTERGYFVVSEYR